MGGAEQKQKNNSIWETTFFNENKIVRREWPGLQITRTKKKEKEKEKEREKTKKKKRKKKKKERTATEREDHDGSRQRAAHEQGERPPPPPPPVVCVCPLAPGRQSPAHIHPCHRVPYTSAALWDQTSTLE